MVEKCRKEGDPDGVYLYHVADMSDPHSAVELIQVCVSIYRMWQKSNRLSYFANF